MKHTRLLAILMALCLLAAALPLASAEEEVITLTIARKTDTLIENLETNETTKAIEEKFGVKLKFLEYPSADAQAKLAVVMASKSNVPDIINFELDYVTEYNYAMRGLLLPLNAYLADPSMTKNLDSRVDAEAKEALLKIVRMPDGNNYGLPSYEDSMWGRAWYHAWINQEWLDALGLDMPKTTEDFRAVLEAFVSQDPNGNGENDEIPLSGAISTAAQVFVTETLGISNNSAGTRSDWYEGEDGSMEYLMTSDLYKTYLERMHYLYAEKLLDNEIYTQSSTQFLAKGANMQIGACRTDAPFVLAGTDPEKYEQYVAFGPIAPEGGEPRQYFNEMYGANLYVTKANQYREVTARLLDYLYTEEWAQIIRGPQLGSEIKGDWDGKGGWYYIDDTQTKYAFEVPEEYSGVYYWRIGAVAPMALRGGLGYSETWMNEVMSDTDTHLRAIYADTWQYTVPCFPQEYSLTQEEADELALISTELKTYVDQMEVKFVVGEVDIDEGWDEFQAHLKSIGVEDYIRINQGAYERYLEIANNLE